MEGAAGDDGRPVGELRLAASIRRAEGPPTA
jgi:hypothetical protein